MQHPIVPSNEAERVASLLRLQVLDTPGEERFDRITRLSKNFFDVPISLISLVDDKRQWFKSRQGLSACETSRDISFCGHAILGEDAFVVENASTDERFHDNPLVVGAPHIRFYAGHPLADPAGNRLGTLCIIDSDPRSFGPADQEALRDLAMVAQAELSFVQLGLTQLDLIGRSSSAQRKSLLDPLTGTWNRAGTSEVLAGGLVRCRGRDLPLSILRVKVSGQQGPRTAWSEQEGEVVLGEVAQALRSCARGHDAIGRIGEDEFLVMLLACDEADAPDCIATVQGRAENNPILQGLSISLSFESLTIEPSDLRPAAELLAGLLGPVRQAA
ncbi:MAG: diguanylate cyclase [Planctomycetota bacterium]|nr:diguanylate cyclase [Planctomycetota bacterium]